MFALGFLWQRDTPAVSRPLPHLCGVVHEFHFAVFLQRFIHSAMQIADAELYVPGGITTWLPWDYMNRTYRDSVDGLHA